MNREISFRGKRTKTVEWVYGLLWHNNEKSAAIYSDKHDRLCWVKPETVGQFAGLTDKNGKRIFEGDIITFPWDEERPTELFEIVFNEGQYLAQPLAHDGKVWAITLNGYTHDMEVVGNIHDNPELLNGTES